MSGWRECRQTRFVLLEGGHYTFLGVPEQLLAEITAVFESGIAAN